MLPNYLEGVVIAAAATVVVAAAAAVVVVVAVVLRRRHHHLHHLLLLPTDVSDHEADLLPTMFTTKAHATVDNSLRTAA